MQQTNPVADDRARYGSLDVGLIFVREYYTFLNTHPHKLHAFYSKDSFFLRGDEGEYAPILHGQEEIRQKIEELQFEDCKVLVTQVDSQASANNGIIVQVLGELCNKNGPSQKFSQTFFLAPQTNGYYVLNDMFRFLKDEVNVDYYTCEDDEVQHQQQLQEPKHSSQPQQEEPVKEETKEEEEEEEAEEELEVSIHPEQPPKEEVIGKEEAAIEDAAGPEPAVKETPKEMKKEVVNGEVNGSKTTEKKLPTPTKPKADGGKTWANLAANDSDKWADARSPAPASIVHPPTKQPQQSPQQQPQQPPQTQGHQQHGHQHNREEASPLQIFIKNVNQHISEENLREAFTAFGVVKKINVAHTKNCAFLDFASMESVHKALSQHKVNVGHHVVLAEERRHGGRHQHNRQPNGRPYDRRYQQDGHRRGGGPPRGGKSRGGSGPK